MAFEGDQELVGCVERGGVVLDLDTEERDDRHVGRSGVYESEVKACYNGCGTKTIRKDAV